MTMQDNTLLPLGRRSIRNACVPQEGLHLRSLLSIVLLFFIIHAKFIRASCLLSKTTLPHLQTASRLVVMMVQLCGKGLDTAGINPDHELAHASSCEGIPSHAGHPAQTAGV